MISLHWRSHLDYWPVANIMLKMMMMDVGIFYGRMFMIMTKVEMKLAAHIHFHFSFTKIFSGFNGIFPRSLDGGIMTKTTSPKTKKRLIPDPLNRLSDIPVYYDQTDHISFRCPICSAKCPGVIFKMGIQSVYTEIIEFQRESDTCTWIELTCPRCGTNGHRKFYWRDYEGVDDSELAERGC